MSRRPPLACPQCAAERSREGGYAVRICGECGVEFRARGRVPIRRGTTPPVERFGGWKTMLIAGGLAALLGVWISINSPPSPSPPPVVFGPPTFVMPALDLEAGIRPLEPPSVDAIIHRLERHDGHVEATGLLAVSGTVVARPQVHVGFFGVDGVELGAVLGNVACSRLDALPCPWGFVGNEPPGTTEVRVRASGQWDMGDLHPVVRLRFGFDDELRSTKIESNLPEFEATRGRLIAKPKDELEVSVSLPDAQHVRSANATLVGYAAASQVELVLPIPSPVGLARRVTLPEHERAIVRWQLWVDGPVFE